MNETCLSCDHEAFLVHERDKDSHNPLLIHFHPHMTHKESRSYRSVESKIANKRQRKERQRENRQKGYREQEEDDDDDEEKEEEEEAWINPRYSQEDWWNYQTHEGRRQQAKGQGRGHQSTGSSSSSWRPKYHQWRLTS